MLCELVPVSIPSLVVNLMVVSLGGLEFAVSRRIHSALKCDNVKVRLSDSLPTLYPAYLQVLISLEELRQNPFQWDLTRCNWEGQKAFYLMNTYNIHRYVRVGSQTSEYILLSGMRLTFCTPLPMPSQHG